jgi:hypothetical protein
VLKFLLNLLVQISKPLVNSKRFSLRISAKPAQAAAQAHSFPGYRLPHSAQQARVLRRRPARFPPPSHESTPASSHHCPSPLLANWWAPPVSSHSHLRPTDPSHTTAESHRVWPPCAAQLRASSGALTRTTIKAPP